MDLAKTCDLKLRKWPVVGSLRFSFKKLGDLPTHPSLILESLFIASQEKIAY